MHKRCILDCVIERGIDMTWQLYQFDDRISMTKFQMRATFFFLTIEHCPCGLRILNILIVEFQLFMFKLLFLELGHDHELKNVQLKSYFKYGAQIIYPPPMKWLSMHDHILHKAILMSIVVPVFHKLPKWMIPFFWPQHTTHRLVKCEMIHVNNLILSEKHFLSNISSQTIDPMRTLLINAIHKS